MKSHSQNSKKNAQVNHESQSNLEKAIHLADSGHCEQALGLLNKGNSLSREITNARGVCLMRMGQAEEAVRILRGMVIPVGVTWMDSKLPVIYRANFALALFLSGRPQGLQETLRELPEKSHPSVVRLYQSLKAWEKSLTFMQWMGWKLGIEQDAPTRVDFVPGDFVDPVTSSQTTPPAAPPVPSPPTQRAA